MKSLYDRLGFVSTVSVALQTTPVYALPALPITLVQLVDVLQKSTDLEKFKEEHIQQKNKSWIYDVFRPRGRDIIPLLRKHYDID